MHFDVLVHLLRYIRDNNKLGLKYYTKIKVAPLSDLLRQSSINSDKYLWRAQTYQGNPTSQIGGWGIRGTLPENNCVEEFLYGFPQNEFPRNYFLWNAIPRNAGEARKTMMRTNQLSLQLLISFVGRIGGQRATWYLSGLADSQYRCLNSFWYLLPTTGLHLFCPVWILFMNNYTGLGRRGGGSNKS